MAGRPSMDWFHVATLRRLALPALVTVLGLQSLRVYYPSLAWYLRDTVGVGSITLGAIAFATFLLGLPGPARAARLRFAWGPAGSPGAASPVCGCSSSSPPARRSTWF